MIKFIAAIDSKQGLADDNGIPWQGKIPTDVKYYKEKIKDGILVYGRNTYELLSEPYKAVRNVVASKNTITNLREGFEQTQDAKKFIQQEAAKTGPDVWVLGGASLFASTFDLAEELYITQLDKDFNSTKFFPDFKGKFELATESDVITENGISYTFQVWKRK